MNAQTKEYEEKVRAELQQAKSRLEEFLDRSKAGDKQVATDLINQLERTHKKIEKQLQWLETSAGEEIEQEKAEIDAGIGKLRAGLTQLATKLNKEPHTKAS
jgi:X-X-X-Leu-X-X-Gly heptad repeat protein